ncbi:MAG TPA: O-antigen ligase family protein, partial [Fimbriimonas sp.]|nr:O-antigen ligase family protein [Fimbriimonas sp.]
ALSLTMSRAGISMGLLGLILGGFLLPSKRVFAVIGVTAMLGGLLASGWNAPTSASRRFEQVGGGSSIVRLELYGAGVRAFAEKPLVGWGPGNVRQALVSDSAANLTESERLNPSYHNLFLDSAAQRGILGLFGTIWFLILVAKDLAKKRETALALSGLAFLGCVLVGFTTVGPWLSVCLLVGLASHSRAAT